MRIEILRLLRQNPGEYVSGEHISQLFSVSRTAVWKHIRGLRQEGYFIESHPRLGYCLRQIPDRLLPEEISSHLKTRSIGKSIFYQASTASTNDEAKRLANTGCIDGTIVLSEEQQKGKGRLSRGWFSPFGKGIWLSIVLRPSFRPQDAPKCTLMAAVALYRAIKKVTPISCGIKWPNDILIQGKKLAGILTEMSAEIDAVNYLVIGMGINVNIRSGEFPDDLAQMATSLAEQVGSPVPRLTLLVALLEELDACYHHVLNKGFEDVLAEWRTYSITLGQEVNVIGIDKTFVGRALDIDEEGALLVQTDLGLERVLAGDVSVRAKTVM